MHKTAVTPSPPIKRLHPIRTAVLLHREAILQRVAVRAGEPQIRCAAQQVSEYFSDRERGPRARTLESIPPTAWGGLVALLRSLVETGAFGVDFPEMCPDGNGPVGVDQEAFVLALRGEIPEIEWPLPPTNQPEALAILDLVEFCHRHVARPIEGQFHPFFGHSHLGFAREEGQQDFRDRVNRIFGRNGVAFEISADGRVIRLAPAVLREALASVTFQTGDTELDSLLGTARLKFLSPDFSTRREALEKLWDAWERAKSLRDPSDKKASVTALLETASSERNFREALDLEARELTRVGNSFRIRHSETTQVKIENSAHVDYLFHRLFALIRLLLRIP
jgi:hypothetical protein